MSKYAEIDDLILKAIGAGRNTFCALLSGPAVRQAAAAADSQAEDWRVVDRRLQALRKKGAITYIRAAGWSLVKPGIDDTAVYTADQLRAAVEADRAARKPLTESAIQQIGLAMPSLLHPGGLIEFARAIERAHGITED
ncbi:MAG: hypothetical protein WCZ20_05300 [Hydrogenophaga sp.]